MEMTSNKHGGIIKSESTSSNYSPTSSPTPENPHLNETVVVKYRVGGDARPHSIDKQIYGEAKERTVWGEDLIKMVIGTTT